MQATMILSFPWRIIECDADPLTIPPMPRPVTSGIPFPWFEDDPAAVCDGLTGGRYETAD